jgi:ubiquinone/menaquinone biosynthesis C-methylase UbiE
MNNAIYNAIGKTYDLTRKADPMITETIIKLLEPKESGKYLDLACGSGNYTVAIHNQNLNIDGIDISDEMLQKAKAKSTAIEWYQGDAESLPFDNHTYNGVICMLATHHMAVLKRVFQEVYRVTAPHSKFIILTATPEQSMPLKIPPGKRLSNHLSCAY